MKVTVERAQLLKSLGHVHRVVERRNTIPILGNVLVRAENARLSLKATDLDLEVTETLAAETATAGSGFRRQRFRHFEVEVGGLQRQFRVFGADQHVAKNRDGVAALDHAMHMAQRFQELRAFDGDLHCKTRLIPRWKSRAARKARRGI